MIDGHIHIDRENEMCNCRLTNFNPSFGGM